MLEALSPQNWAALVGFAVAWFVLEFVLDHSPWRNRNLSTLMASRRLMWMRATAERDVRMIDTQILMGQQNAAAFFASASMLAMGASISLLGATEEVLQIYRDLPVSSDISRQLWEMKVLGLAFIFVYSFFKFAWSFRLFNYSAILVGGVPPLAVSESDQRQRAGRAAAQMNIIASRHFNAGLRAIFFALAYLGWFLGPISLIFSTLFVLLVLIRRQYFSRARQVLVQSDIEEGR